MSKGCFNFLVGVLGFHSFPELQEWIAAAVVAKWARLETRESLHQVASLGICSRFGKTTAPTEVEEYVPSRFCVLQHFVLGALPPQLILQTTFDNTAGSAVFLSRPRRTVSERQSLSFREKTDKVSSSQAQP